MKKSKEIISDKVATVNQILPHTNKWAWDLFIDGAANNWMPTEVSMAKDIEQWKSGVLSENEKLVVKRCLGFFAGSESLVANNLLLSIFKFVTDAECRQYILRQAYEESLHNLTVVYCCDSLSLDIDEVYQAHMSVPSIKSKDDFTLIEFDENSYVSKILKENNLEEYIPTFIGRKIKTIEQFKLLSDSNIKDDLGIPLGDRLLLTSIINKLNKDDDQK